MSRLGLARIETPDKTKSPGGGLTVLDLLTTKALVLIVKIQYHAPVIANLRNPSKVHVQGDSNRGLSAGLRTTASSVVICIGK